MSFFENRMMEVNNQNRNILIISLVDNICSLLLEIISVISVNILGDDTTLAGQVRSGLSLLYCGAGQVTGQRTGGLGPALS